MENPSRELEGLKTSMTVPELNNLVVSMRPLAEQVKVQLIKKLHKQANKYRNRKCSEEEKAPFIKKAERIQDEIQMLKRVDKVQLIKYSLANTLTMDEAAKQNDLTLKVMTRAAVHKPMQTKVKAWREKHSDWQSLAAFMLSKNSGRRFKKNKKGKQLEIAPQKLAELMPMRIRADAEEEENEESEYVHKEEIEEVQEEENRKVKLIKELFGKEKGETVTLEREKEEKEEKDEEEDSEKEEEEENTEERNNEVTPLELRPQTESSEKKIKDSKTNTRNDDDEEEEEKDIDKDSFQADDNEDDKKSPAEIIPNQPLKKQSKRQIKAQSKRQRIPHSTEHLEAMNDGKVESAFAVFNLKELRNKETKVLPVSARTMTSADDDEELKTIGFYDGDDSDGDDNEAEKKKVKGSKVVSFFDGDGSDDDEEKKKKYKESKSFNKKKFQGLGSNSDGSDNKKKDWSVKGGDRPGGNHKSNKWEKPSIGGGQGGKKFGGGKKELGGRKDFKTTEKAAPAKQAEKLHPSWEASKKRKAEQSTILPFQGKRIKFD